MVKQKNRFAADKITGHLLAVVKKLDLDLLQEFGAIVPFKSYYLWLLLPSIRYAYRHKHQPIIQHLILNAPIRARYISWGITKSHQEKARNINILIDMY